MRILTLDAEPHLAPLLARAAVIPRRPGALPQTRVERRGIVVDRARLAAYDRVCGFAVRDVLPSTYLHVLSFGLQAALMAERDFPFPLAGLVHVAQTLRQHRAVDAGEVLTLVVHAERLRGHRRGAQVDLVSTASAGDEPVWSATSTYLRRLSSAQQGHADPEEEPPAVDGPPTARWRVPADAGRRYAAVSGDVNPIHLAAPAARLFGFPRAIAHGMWTAARCLASLEPWTPPAHEVRVVFRRPVLLPSTVELRTRAADGGWAFGLTSRSGAEHVRGLLVPR